MAFTDFPVAASSTVVVIYTVANTAFVITCDLTDVTYDKNRTVAKTETFCAIRKSPQSPDIKLTFTGLYNGNLNEADAVLNALMGDSGSHLYKYGPAGSGTGDPLYSGVGFITAYQIKATAGGNVGITGTLEVNGGDVRSSWP